MRGLGSYLYVEELLTGQQGHSLTCHFETNARPETNDREYH